MIGDEWKKYENGILHCKEGSALHRLLKTTFYCGASSAVHCLRQIALTPEMSDQKGAELFMDIDAEVKHHLVDAEIKRLTE